MTEILKAPGAKYVPSSELTALSRRARMIEKTRMIDRGISPVLADLYLDLQEKCMEEAVTRYFMDEGSCSTGGLQDLLK